MTSMSLVLEGRVEGDFWSTLHAVLHVDIIIALFKRAFMDRRCMRTFFKGLYNHYRMYGIRHGRICSFRVIFPQKKTILIGAEIQRLIQGTVFYLSNFDTCIDNL